MAIVLDGTSGITTPGLTNTGVETISGVTTIQGITVGKGGGAVSTNTAVGASAMANMTSSGFFDVAIGYNALYTSTGGIANNAIGYRAMYATTTGANSQALGASALAANTTGSFLVAVGDSALAANTTGNNSVAIGQSALQANTTASNNTAVGYQAGYSNQTGQQNTFIGIQTGYSTTGLGNTFVGHTAGYYTSSGTYNTFIGYGSAGGAGVLVTTGSKNAILGGFSGNQGGLDIRTASNYIVLSDGDGNPRAFCNGSGYWVFGGSSNLGSAQNSIYYTPGTTYGLGFKPSTNSNTPKPCSFLEASGVEVGSITTSGSATLYNVTSDQRLKENIVNAPDFGSVIDSLQVRSFDWKSDSTHQRAGFIAQELVAVAPEAVYQPVDTEQMMAVDYSKLVPMLVKEVQSLRARVAQLEGN